MYARKQTLLLCVLCGLVYISLCCPVDVSVLYSSVLSLDVSVFLFHRSLYCPCCLLVSGLQLLDVFVQQQAVLCQDVYSLQQLVLDLNCLSCCIWTCLSTKSFVRHLDVSAYKSFVLHLDGSVYKSLCCTWTCLSTRALC